MSRVGDVLAAPHEALAPRTYRAALAGAMALAVAGGLLYLLSQTAWSWWAGALLVVPLVWLGATRLGPRDGSVGDGPIAPP
jgi:apolipoprotein N-acyltransferase